MERTRESLSRIGAMACEAAVIRVGVTVLVRRRMYLSLLVWFRVDKMGRVCVCACVVEGEKRIVVPTKQVPPTAPRQLPLPQ